MTKEIFQRFVYAAALSNGGELAVSKEFLKCTPGKYTVEETETELIYRVESDPERFIKEAPVD